MLDVLLGAPGGPREITKLLATLQPKRARGQAQTNASKAFDLNLLTAQEMGHRVGKPLTASKIARGVAEVEIDIEEREAVHKSSKHEREKKISRLARNIENRFAMASGKRALVKRWCDLAAEGYSPETCIKMILAENHE